MKLNIGLNKKESLKELLNHNGEFVQIEDGRYLRVCQVEDAENPIDWGHCNFLNFHKGYPADNEFRTICDKNGKEHHISEFDTAEEIHAFLDRNDYVYICVHAYIYSGIALSENLSCRWDSSEFGVLYESKETIRKEINKQRLSAKSIEDYKEIMRWIMQELNYWLEGENYDIRFYNSKLEEEDVYNVNGYINLSNELERILGLDKRTA